jgi:hypothetical protein
MKRRTAPADLGDFSATGGTLANLTATANPRIYTVELRPTPA